MGNLVEVKGIVEGSEANGAALVDEGNQRSHGKPFKYIKYDITRMISCIRSAFELLEPRGSRRLESFRRFEIRSHRRRLAKYRYITLT